MDDWYFTDDLLMVEGEFLYDAMIPRNLQLADTVSSLEGEEKTRFLDFPLKMLRWLPEERKTAEELLEDPWLHDIE